MTVLRSFVILLLTFTLAVACNKEQQFRANEKVERAFAELYPEVTKVEWDKKEAHYIARFWDTERGVKAEAWFDYDGIWYLTESRCALNNLPRAIKRVVKTLDNNETVRVDRVERMESSTIYIIELEGEQPNNFIYNEEGELLCQGG